MSEKIMPSGLISSRSSSGEQFSKPDLSKRQFTYLLKECKEAEAVMRGISDWSAGITRYGSLSHDGLHPRDVIRALALRYKELTGQSLIGEGTPYYFGGHKSVEGPFKSKSESE